jgi:hypothetical protein
LAKLLYGLGVVKLKFAILINGVFAGSPTAITLTSGLKWLYERLEGTSFEVVSKRHSSDLGAVF